MSYRKPLTALLPDVVRALVRGDASSLPALAGAPPIVLLHGFGTSSRVLAPLARQLGRHLGRPVVRLRLGARLPLHLGDVRATARRVQDELDRLAVAAPFPYVDVVGHSLGGLVAAYLLKALDRGRRIRRVITLATPHRGTPVAWLGVLLVGAFSRAVWQMVPGAPLLRELGGLPVPECCELIAFDSDVDEVVPPGRARVPAAPRQLNLSLQGLGHVDFLWSPQVFGALQRALS